MIIQKTKKILKSTFPGLHRKWADRFENPYKEEVSRILNQKEQVFYGEQEFQKLQEEYPMVAQYGYTPMHTWMRGSERSNFLMKNFNAIQQDSKKILEVGCGDGMTGYLLSTFGHQVTLTDMDDWRDSRVKSLPYIKCSLTEKMPIEHNAYDFIYSYNTFEHVFEPKKALDELIRIIKPGGYLYLDFGPLYSSAWGLHAFNVLNMPYPQFLFSKEFYMKKIRDSKNFDIGREMSTLQPMNEWRVKQYDDVFLNSGCEVVAYKKAKHYSYLRIVKDYPQAFGGLGLTYDDVTVHCIRITLRKKA